MFNIVWKLYTYFTKNQNWYFSRKKTADIAKFLNNIALTYNIFRGSMIYSKSLISYEVSSFS